MVPTIDHNASTLAPAPAKLGMPVMLMPFLITQNSCEGVASQIEFKKPGLTPAFCCMLMRVISVCTHGKNHKLQ